MNHSEQIEAHVRIEAAQDLHDELQAMRLVVDHEARVRNSLRLYFAPHAENCQCPGEGFENIKSPQCWPENMEKEYHESVEPEREWARGSD
jgi:hypothetical protein